MKKYLSILIILFYFQKIISQCEFENKQLVIINEVGSFVTHPDTKHHINAEYIELLVLGDPNRPYSPVNIRGIIIDDNNIPVAEIGSEPGYIQLSDEFPLVYPGTLILIYDPDGYIVDESKDGEPNGSGVYQIPFNSPLIKKIEDKYFFPYNNYGYEKDTGWDGFIPFRNYGDIAQIISSKGKLIQGLSWNCCGDPFEYPEGSFFWNENLKNRTIQLTNGRYSDKTSYRISGYSSPGEPNTPENEEFINSLKNGVISALGEYSVTILKNQIGSEANASIEILLEGTSGSQTDWYAEIDGVKYENPDKKNPLKIENIYGGSKQIIVYIWNETLKQYCPFEKTIFMPTELEKRDDPVCKGECITLVSEGEYCVAWVDEKGRLLGNGIEYTICPENDITITEIIENLNGIVVKRINHILQTKKSNYVLNTMIPELCPPEEVILSISGTDISVTWADNGSEEKERKVTSPGKYDVSILDNKNNCTYQETFIVGEEIFKDSDGDGLCDDKDCYPSDPALIIEKGSPCDDNNACTSNDVYNQDCECEGESPQYGLSVEITGGMNICGQQTETQLTVEATGGMEPYEILWNTGATSETINITQISQGGGEIYSVTVTDYNGCSQEASVQLTRYDSDDSDGDGYCDEIDCAPFSETLGGPGSPCDDDDPTTINDVHDANCNCAGIPNPCDGIDLDGDGLCADVDCDDTKKEIGSVGSPCDDGDTNTINDRMDATCNCVGEKTIKIKEIYFTGIENSNYIPITKDVGGMTYLSPQYVLDNTGNVAIKNPVAYVSGTKAKVKAVFETSINSDRYIRGLGPNITGGQILFPSQKCTSINGIMTYNEIKANLEFTNNTVNYWDDFEIKWQFSIDNTNWMDIGISRNQMYVTYKEPYIPSTYGWQIDGHGEETKAYHTILHLGCKNAKAQNTENNIVDFIYNQGFKFDSNQDKVFRVDGAGPIKYWGKTTGNPTIIEWFWKTSGLLQVLSGTCGGWAVFFEDVLRIQGIKTSKISTVTYNEYVLSSSDLTKLDSDIKSFFGNEETYVKKLPPDVEGYTGTRSDFFVKKWNLNSTVPFVMNEYKNGNPSDLTLANGKIIKVEEQTGASGQGNIDPRSEFENHAIVKYNNKYYDPSYGSAIANDANSWETPALDGFGSIVFYQKEAKKSYVNWVGHLNDTSPQAKIKP